MARIASYQKDNSLHEKDKLFGSSYISTNNNVDQFTTGNFTLLDLAEFFANYQISDNQLYNFATISQQVTTNVSNISSNATYSLNLAATFGTFDSSGNLTSLSEAFADSVITTTASDRFATTTSVNTLTSTVEGKPDVFRQDDAPATTNPVGSIWYDTNDNNKVYVLVSGTPNVWTETSDDRIVTNSQSISSVNQSVTTLSNSLTAEAALIDELQTQFTFDINGGITGTADALATSITTASSNAAGAVATDLDRLEAQFTFDSNGDVSGVAGALATSITTTSSNAAGAVASDLDKLEAVFTFDSNNNVNGVAGALNTSINTAASTASNAVATDLDKLEVVFSFDSNGDVDGIQGSLSTAVTSSANTAISNASLASASEVNELKTQFTFDSNNNITGVADALNTSINTAQSNAESASATKVDTLASKFFTGYNNADGSFTAVSVTEAFADNVFETTTNTDFASASEFTALSAVVGGDDTEGLRADIIENADVIATVEGYAESRYSLKLDANGSFAGMSILAQNGATSDPYSEIRFVADSFKIYNGGQADLAGSYDAPFEVVNNVVKIKSANIGTVSFGDLSNVPTTFVSTVIYADDSSGTNASTTKGASQNFFAIKQAATAWQNGDSVSGLVFAQITGDTGATGATGPAGADGANGADGADGAQGPQGPQGPQGIAGTNGTDGADGINGTNGIDGTNGVDGKRTSTGILWYYQGQSSAPTVPSTITAGYRFSDGTFNSTSANTLPTNWAYESPLMYAGTASNQYWTVAYTAIETSAGSGYGTVTFASSAIKAFAFNQVVTFNSLSTSGSTTINGDNITTGQIQSANYGSVSGNYSTAGSIINLTNGNIYTPNFSIIGGAARFKGDLEAAGGTFSGNLSVTGTALIQGAVSSGDYIAAKFKNTDSTNNTGAGISLNSSNDYHHRILMTGGTTTNVNGVSSFDLNASYQLGQDSQYSKKIIKLNGAGLLIPNQTANGITASADYSGGMNIIFNDNDGARTTSSGRLHVSEYFKTFFLDIPSAQGSTGTYQNDIFQIRKLISGSPDYERTVLKIDTNDDVHIRGTIYAQLSTNHYLDMDNTGDSLKVAGDVVAYVSSDKRYKDNIVNISNPLNKLNKINGVSFTWNEVSHKETGKKDIGVIAQEIEEIFPEIVETRENGYKAVDYPKLTALLIEAVKELSDKVKKLEDGITK